MGDKITKGEKWKKVLEADDRMQEEQLRVAESRR